MAGLTPYLTRYSKALAVVGALALHVAVVVMLILPPSGALRELDTRMAGDETVESIDVSLFDTATEVAGPVDMASQFAPMLDTTADDSWTPSDTPKPAPQSLADLFGDPVRKNQSQAQTDEAHKSTSQAHSGNENIADLWQTIEPCWQRITNKDTVGVTLSVSFSALGNIASPPQPIRIRKNKPSKRELEAEMLAVEALTRCGPYLMAYGRDNIQINFPGR